MGWKTYPDPPDSWTEDTLTPEEGAWTFTYPTGLKIEVANDQVAVGSFSIRVNNEDAQDVYLFRVAFVLHEGKEFDATKFKELPRLKFYTRANEGSDFITGHTFHIRLYDVAGKYAEKKYPGIDDIGKFVEFDLPVGPGSGWTEEEGFDWRFIKTIEFIRSGFTNDYFWIDGLHFSYYEVVLAKLTVLSQPPGKEFRLDDLFFNTPITLELVPGTYQIYMEPTNFDAWEDGSKEPLRTIELKEGEERTIIAYYAKPISRSNILLISLILITIFIPVGLVIYKRAKR